MALLLSKIYIFFRYPIPMGRDRVQIRAQRYSQSFTICRIKWKAKIYSRNSIYSYLKDNLLYTQEIVFTAVLKTIYYSTRCIIEQIGMFIHISHRKRGVNDFNTNNLLVSSTLSLLSRYGTEQSIWHLIWNNKH